MSNPGNVGIYIVVIPVQEQVTDKQHLQDPSARWILVRFVGHAVLINHQSGRLLCTLHNKLGNPALPEN